MADRADLIRAVGIPEKKNLELVFKRHPNIQLIANGVKVHKVDLRKKDDNVRKVLYMSRLHHKKGVVELVKAWLKSSLNKNAGFELIIAGPDQGELEQIQSLLDTNPDCNITYIGPVYGPAKEAWLERASYYILPSKSEGFPTAILEAMSYGLIPLITEGCNFPDVFEHRLGIKISPQIPDILDGLNQLTQMKGDAVTILQGKASDYINKHYSLDFIAEQQVKAFKAILAKKSTVQLA